MQVRLFNKNKFKEMPSSEFCMGYVSCLMLDLEACKCERIFSAYTKK